MERGGTLLKKGHREEGNPGSEGVSPGAELGDRSSHSWLTIRPDRCLPQTIDITGWGTITKAHVLRPGFRALSGLQG